MGISNKSRPASPPDSSERARTDAKNWDVISRFTWVVASLGVHLDELRYHWGKRLGITGPQWMILMAIAELDQGDGVPVSVVSKKLHVDSSFITTQSKILEEKGFIHRKSSIEDGRVVQMSLTDKSRKQLAGLAPQREALNQFILGELDGHELGELTDKLVALQARLEKACVKVVLDI